MSRWNNIWNMFALMACASILTLLLVLAFSTRYTKAYSLGSSQRGNGLIINKEIEWGEDDEIVLDRTISYSQAIGMVDSLNKTIKK